MSERVEEHPDSHSDSFLGSKECRKKELKGPYVSLSFYGQHKLMLGGQGSLLDTQSVDVSEATGLKIARFLSCLRALKSSRWELYIAAADILHVHTVKEKHEIKVYERRMNGDKPERKQPSSLRRRDQRDAHNSELT